jgi:hypothetical protein
MFTGVPIIKDLSRCRRSDYGEAAKEVAGSFLLALIPVWLGAVVLALVPNVSVAHYVSEFFVSGEALLVSTALIGPNIYVATKKYGSFKDFSIHFPQAWFLTTVSSVICMITAAIFGTQRVYVQLSSAGKEPIFDPTVMFRLSLAIVVITVLALYLVTVFRNYAEGGAASRMHSDEQDFVDEFRIATKKRRRRR